MSDSDSDHAASDATGWIADTRLRGRPSVKAAMARILEASDTTLGVSRSTLDRQYATATVDLAGLAHSDGVTLEALERDVRKRLNKLLETRYIVSTTLHGTVLHVRLRDKEVNK